MAEISPREQYPEVVVSAEHLSEPDAIEAVKAERVDLQGQVDTALDMIRSLDPSADAADIDTAYEFLQESRARLATFNEMWSNLGGDAIDQAEAETLAAKAAVADAKAASTGPTDTRPARAKRRLAEARDAAVDAEDAFYGRMRDASDTMQDEAKTMMDIDKEKEAVTLGQIEDAEKEAHDAAAVINGTLVDQPTALNEAYTEYEARAGTPYDHAAAMKERDDQAREAAIVAAGTRVVNVEAARQQAIQEEDGRALEAAREAAGTRLNYDDAFDAAIEERDHRQRDLIVETAGTLVPDVETARELANAEEASRVREAAAEAAGTRVTNVEDARVQAIEQDAQYEHDNRWFRRAYRRMNVAFVNGIERFKNQDRKTKVGIVLGAVAVVGVSIWLARSGHNNAIPMDQASFDPGTGGGKSGGPGDFVPAPGGHGGGPGDYVGTPGEQGGGAGDFVKADLLPAFSSKKHDFPFDWAKDAFGADKAMDGLEELGKKAAEDGHKIEWHTTGDGVRWVEVDGRSGTEHVVDVLRQYAK